MNNPTFDQIQALNNLGLSNKVQFFMHCDEHSGHRPVQLQADVVTVNGTPATWTRHFHVYIQFKERQYRSVFKKLLKFEGDSEPAKGKVEQVREYMRKGDILTTAKYPNLPVEFNNLVIKGPTFVEFGEPVVVIAQNSSEHAIVAGATKKKNLMDELKKYDCAQTFVIADPQLYSRYRNGIRDYYNAVLRMKPCEMPIIEWHFGATRSGKTYTGYQLTGGKNCPDTHYQIGPFEWLTNYRGQETMFLNEYRASSKEAFCILLSIMEGFPADIKVKGDFCPVRIKKLIITCPRPPKALTCELFGYATHFEGEFATKDKYDPQHLLTAWEDVDQVLERIIESGGKLVAHARRRPLLDHGVDNTRWEYTSKSIINGMQDAEFAAGFDHDMDDMLNELQPMDE